MITSLGPGALLSGHPEHLQELVEVLSGGADYHPGAGGGRGNATPTATASQKARLQLSQQHSAYLHALATCLLQLSSSSSSSCPPLPSALSRRLGLTLTKDWARFLRAGGAGLRALQWLPALLAHVLPGVLLV